MIDSLHTQGETLAGIPEAGTRITVLVILGVVVAVTILLLYLRMKESDEATGL